MSIQTTDAEAQAVAVAPRVKLSDIEDAILHRIDTTADTIGIPDGRDPSITATLSLLSVCILVMRNGFVVVGKSAPASPANFDRQLGRKFAYEDAVRQLWPLMGYSLRDVLHRAELSLLD
jgi:hypothetical protein